MDIEFHYYMTYLIAVRAGFTPADAAIIAQSAQEIDDNHIPIEVSAGTAFAFKSTLSKTMDILHPRHNKQIYPIFHFIPGDPNAPSAARKDGRKSVWVTTPNSALANTMLDTSLKSGSLYRIGASAHAYADTWAHQNFLGIDDNYNEMPRSPTEGIVEKVMDLIKIAMVGHALAQHQPDIPGLIWTDGRLANPVVDNTPRFLDAANHLFRKFYSYKHGTQDALHVDIEAASLLADLKLDIGSSSEQSIQRNPTRIERYKNRAITAPYGRLAIPDYLLGKWADAAFVEKRADIAIRLEIYMAENAGIMGDALDFGTRMPCTWTNPAQYRDTDWFKFQEAVRSHLDECWGVLIKQDPAFAS
jgi:hypothetical protein